MCSNSEWKLHNSIAIKEFLKHILQCTFGFSIVFLHYTIGCIWYIINDCTTSFNLIFFWEMTVIDVCLFCKFFENRGIDSTDAYVNTFIITRRITIAPILLYHFLIQVQWSLQMVHIHIFPTLSCVFPSLFKVDTVYTIPIFQFYPLFSGQNSDLHHEDTIWSVRNLQHHDMVNLLDINNLLPFVLLLDMSNIFLYLL